MTQTFLTVLYLAKMQPLCSTAQLTDTISYWSDTNPLLFMEGHTERPRKVLCNRFIGPIFTDGNLDSRRYLFMLQDDIVPRIQEVTREKRVTLITECTKQSQQVFKT